MKKNKFLFFILIILIAGGFFVAYRLSKRQASLPPADNAYKPGAQDQVPPVPEPSPASGSPSPQAQTDHVLLNVPFTSQAPTGNWSDPKQEDGCEEASVLMAWLWIKNLTTTPSEAEKTIIAMSDFETAHYGNYNDLDAEDTAKFMTDYYNYSNLVVKLNPSISDIKDALKADKLVLVPANGQKLANPHYTQPGPLTHMLVIKGFDDSKQIFITNDSGTRYGEGYEYTYQTLYNAMVDYPSGNHESQVGRPKAMIVIAK